MNDSTKFVLQGKISKKENKDTEAKQFFEKGMKINNPESMYEYAKIMFLGQGAKKDDKQGIHAN